MALSYVASLILVSDVLTETKMKPWWEVVRGIAVVVMFVTALIMLPLSVASTVHCIPRSNVTLTNTEISYVNGICYGDFSFVISKDASLLLLLCALIIHFWYSWWLVIPSVKNKFGTVRDANDALKELVLLEEDIVELGLHSPFASSNIHKISENDGSIEKNYVVIRKVARSLWLCSHSTYVAKCYSKRNIGGIIILLIVFVFSVALIVSTFSQGTEFQCKKTLTVKEVKFSDFSCSSDFSFIPFVSFTIVYTISVFLQLGLTIFICFRSRNKKDDWKLIKEFAKNSTELNGGTQKLLLSREEVVKEMKPFLKKAVEVRDFDFINLYQELGDVQGKNKKMQKEIRKSFKRRIDDKEVADEDLKELSKYCMEKKMYESFVLAHYKNFGWSRKKNYDYEDCGCCNLPLKFNTEDESTGKSLLHHVLTSKAKAENGQVIFNHLAIKHLLYWIIRRSGQSEIPVVTLQLAQNNQADIQEENDAVSETDRLIPNKQEKNESLNIVCKDEVEMFELSFILQECKYGKEIGITEENRNRYNVYRAIRNLKQEVDFVFEDHKSFCRQMYTFWFISRMLKEVIHLYKLIYKKSICPERVEFDIQLTVTLHYVLDSHNEKDETVFNFLTVEHFLHLIRKHRGVEICLQKSEIGDVLYQRDQPEKLELSFLLDNCRYGDKLGFTNENHRHHKFYRAIRSGGEVTAEMKNFVFGGDKSFYKELSRFWLRNKFYREYVELHKLFYSSCNDQNHGNIDCGCNEMTFHLTDTEPGSKGRSLLYYVLVNLDPVSEAMKHVLKWGRERQNDSEHKKVKVVIRGANYVGRSLMDYVNHPQNFDEPARKRLIEVLGKFHYQIRPRDRVAKSL